MDVDTSDGAKYQMYPTTCYTIFSLRSVRLVFAGVQAEPASPQHWRSKHAPPRFERLDDHRTRAAPSAVSMTAANTRNQRNCAAVNILLGVFLMYVFALVTHMLCCVFSVWFVFAVLLKNY
jgi:Flp pilus assembly protein TadB